MVRLCLHCLSAFHKHYAEYKFNNINNHRIQWLMLSLRKKNLFNISNTHLGYATHTDMTSKSRNKLFILLAKKKELLKLFF
jgi:hypothetical protein